MKIYELFTAQELNIEITGTSGTANITINGKAYLSTFDADLDTTAAAFVTDHEDDILADHNIVVTNPTGAEVLFVGADGALFTIAIAAATGDLDGTETGAVVGSFAKLTTSAIANGGNLTIMQITGDNATFKDDVALMGAYEVLKREVKHESDIVTYATDNSLKLNRTENDGSSVASLV
jgi:hypothetical protein